MEMPIRHLDAAWHELGIESYVSERVANFTF